MKKRRLGFTGWLILGMIVAAAYATFAEQGPNRRINARLVADAGITVPAVSPQGGLTA